MSDLLRTPLATTLACLVRRARRGLLSAGAVAFSAAPAAAQSAAAPALHASALHLPRAVRQAYARGTRSPDGRPGARYWQNHARYAITVTALPPDRTVRGSEQITYHNDSPDTLRALVFKLFLNIHKPGAPREASAAADYLTSGVHVDAFAVNGAATPWGDDARTFTVRRVQLTAPLLPRDSVRLSFDWHYDVSREAGREGMLDSTTFYLAYFYPRVAVYDDYNGWDTMTFTDAQEFYSDFNDYDVTVRVPRDYVVWGTGTLANAAEVLRPAPLARFRASLASDTTVHVATRAELAAHAVTAQPPNGGAGPGTNAWHFTAAGVPDVTFALGDHYVWDAGGAVVDSATGRRAGVQAAYNDTAADFHYMVQFGRHALGWLSRNWPGVPYPYEKTTVVQGSADMEYPMMVNDGSTSDTTFSRFVVEHEIAHTWFPFYMGINETRYGFMDEGWATTFEYLINQADLGPARAATFYKDFRIAGWIHDPSPLEDLPIITPGDVLSGRALGNNEYGKASLGYLAVKDLLGDALFRRALHAFIERWHGKHPLPWDFFNTVNDVAGRDLDWFWRAWYFSNSYIDLGVDAVRPTPTGCAVALRNVGGMPAPVDLVLGYADGTSERVHVTPAVWAADPARATVAVATRKTLRSLALDGGIFMDADPSNDRWSAGTPGATPNVESNGAP
ncbi:peptidase [Gemmatimonadetes bacterium T265]|nr:peptidase [Gemmatimonadetes bacterium T265]